MDCRDVFLDRAIDRSSTEEEQEKFKPDKDIDLRDVLSARLSRKALARLVAEQCPDDDWHVNCSCCCCEVLARTKFRPLMTSDVVELCSSTMRRISWKKPALISSL